MLNFRYCIFILQDTLHSFLWQKNWTHLWQKSHNKIQPNSHNLEVVCFQKIYACETEPQFVTPWPVVSGWQRGVLSILQPTIWASQVVIDQPLATFAVQKIVRSSLSVSLYVVRPPLMFSCLHKLPQTISNLLRRSSSRTQHDGGCNKEKSKASWN